MGSNFLIRVVYLAAHDRIYVYMQWNQLPLNVE